MIKIFEIPICFRAIFVGGKENKKNSKLVMIDGKGVFVNYNKEKDLINIKKKPSVKRSFLFVPAENYIKALTDVFAQCAGINFGGEDPITKAVWIDKDVAIIEYPFCFMLYKTNGNFVCRNLSLENCFVYDYQYKEYCPIGLCRINTLMKYEEKIKNFKKIIFGDEEYDFLKIGYEFNSPKVKFKNIPIKGLFS